ncbi:MAG: glycosyltransferase [Acidobacteriota bacterium]
MRRLLIVSHTPHYPGPRPGDGAGGVLGWGATVRELDRLATLFDEVVHLAPLYDLPPPPSSRAYAAPNLRLRPLRPAGGESLAAKLGIVRGAPAFYAALADEVRRADAVHVRAPANLALLTFLARPLLGRDKPWWVKYAGNWRPSEGSGARQEARSYRLQRAWLRRPRRRLAVTVNGRWQGDGPHVRSFLNPCLGEDELERALDSGEREIAEPLEMLFVGRLEDAKGAGRALELLARTPRARLVLAGDGPLRPELERRAAEGGLNASFRGWLPRERLDACYRSAHLLLLPSLASEGWPKVISEAMAWGVVPVTSDVSSMPQILAELGVGGCGPAEDLDALAGEIERLRAPRVFSDQSAKARRAAGLFTYERYLGAVRDLFSELQGGEAAGLSY